MTSTTVYLAIVLFMSIAASMGICGLVILRTVSRQMPHAPIIKGSNPSYSGENHGEE